MAVASPTFVQPLASDHTNLGKVVVVDIVFDSSYADGGEAFDLGQLGINEAWFVSAHQKLPSAADQDLYTFQWDYDANKFIVYWVDTTVDGKGLVEIATATDLSGVTVRALVYGLPS